ncbi:uncharacterized protein LOC110984658 isoform X2 [Acanthaster planci]|nr:uncharacterized protein LOC110984658 isoform X2 [Acanthaster planci]XP_022100742.1 uncharacterized protein LOC110984658 isoform X2 [Acanthaster planci]XP_022100743.1 uncharacterized protein LOC110984658 isoform X2 [Acanthaster planci]
MTPISQPGVITQQSGQPLRTSPSSNTPYKRVPGLTGLSVVHIVLGSLTTLLGIVAIVLRCSFSYAGWGIWSGLVFFLLTGILGVGAVYRKNNKCMVIAVMVMSILTAVAACQLLIVSAIAIANELSYYCIPDPRQSHDLSCIVRPAPRQAVDSLLAILGLAEMVISIVTASMSCYGVCSCCNSYTPVTVQYVPQPANAQFVSMTTMQQQVPGIRFAGMNAPQQFQQQPMQIPAAARGTSAGPLYATNYNVAPTQQVANFPQGNTYAPQPVRGPAVQAPQPVNVTPQPAGVAPRQVVVTMPGQAPPTGSVGAGMQTAEGQLAFSNQTGVVETGGSEHFHHDDKEGLLETS